MVKGDDDVYTGELSLPKGTKFDIKILKSTVSETSGGDNAWSAIRYASTLNNSASHDFGEFTDNLIPNGDFEKGTVGWNPSNIFISKDKSAPSGEHILVTGTEHPNVVTSAPFTIPPNQKLNLSLYATTSSVVNKAIFSAKIVSTQIVMFEGAGKVDKSMQWKQFSGTFTTGSTPMEAQIVLTSSSPRIGMHFDKVSLVSP